MADDTYTSNKRLNTGASEFNALSFIIENAIKGLVNTAIPVRVDACTVNSEAGSMQPAGYVSVTPLVQQRGADGKALDPVSIPKLPYFRYRAGKAALVMDPQPGDIGMAVFAQQDISNLTQEGNKPVPAGSFRSYDMSDGAYFGGLLGPSPEVWVYIAPTEGKIEINAPKDIILKSGTKIDMQAPEISMKGSQSVTTQAPQVSTTSPDIAMNGPITAHDVSGGGGGRMTVNGSMRATGTLNSDTSMSAPEFYGHLNGDVNGECSAASH